MTTTHGPTVTAEIQKLKDANDQMLEKIQELVLERDVLQEQLAFTQSELQNCYESNGLAL